MSIRVMAGLENLEGGQTNSLRIGRMLRRRPEPLYLTICDLCGAESSATHTRLRNGAARCLAAGCGKATTPRDNRTIERLDAAARENARLAEEREASARRMEAESLGWERPTKYRPDPTPYVPRSSREMADFRARRAELEAEEAERLRPIREAEQRTAEEQAAVEEQLKTTASQLAQIERERLATSKDEQFVIDPATIGESALVPTHQLDDWHKAEMSKFLAANPSYYACSENVGAILGYLKRNAPALKLVSAAQITAAYERLGAYGLLKQRPTAAPVVQPAPQSRRVNLSPAQPTERADPKSQIVDGWEIDGSAPRKWTQRQLDRLSADDYRRALHLYREHIQMPGRLG